MVKKNIGTVFSAFWLDVLLTNRPPASRLHSHPHHSLSHWKKTRKLTVLFRVSDQALFNQDLDPKILWKNPGPNSGPLSYWEKIRKLIV
jgi:hypothetical protein